MSQVSSLSIPGGLGGTAFRGAANELFAAAIGANSGSSAPSLTIAGMLWLDTSTTPATLKQRDKSNSAWSVIPFSGDEITVADATADTSAVARGQVKGAAPIGASNANGSASSIACTTDPWTAPADGWVLQTINVYFGSPSSVTITGSFTGGAMTIIGQTVLSRTYMRQVAAGDSGTFTASATNSTATVSAIQQVIAFIPNP